MTRAIPALPPHLRQPPDSLVSPDDPNRDEKRAAFAAWRDGVLRYRLERWMLLRDNPDLIPFELRFCQDPAYWLLIWGHIYEPRPQRDRSPDAPFVLYPFQIDTIDWFAERLDAEGSDADGVYSKSRDMGASWLLAAFALHGWRFAYPWQVRLVSWRADEVDAKNPDSIFWKIDYILNRLPVWMLPKGFDREVHRLKMTLINPENGNVIAGQASTERAMRGGRATWVGYDEAAINKLFEESWSGTANVTNHRIAVSSEHLDFNDFFYRLRTGEGIDPDQRPAVFAADYWLHPGHDEAWLDDQRARNAASPGAFEREVLRDPRAGDTTFVYPSAMDKTPVTADFIPGAPLYVGIDPGYNDETAIVWMQPQPDGRMKVLNAYQAAKKTAAFWGTILRGTPYLRGKEWPAPDIAYDISGPIPDGWERVGLTPTEAEPEQWSYTEREYDLMAWVRTLPKPQVFGDTQGNSTLGATKDTVYTRLVRYGIVVNTDRYADGSAPAWKMQARTFKGRQEAMKELLPRLDFADSWGGRLALTAMQNYRWTASDKPRVSEPKTPLHDAHSHLVTAMEYVAVNLHLRRQIARVKPRPPQQGYMGAATTGGYVSGR